MSPQSDDYCSIEIEADEDEHRDTGRSPVAVDDESDSDYEELDAVLDTAGDDGRKTTSVRAKALPCTPGKAAELPHATNDFGLKIRPQQGYECTDGSFVWIRQLLKEHDGETWAQGLKMQRNIDIMHKGISERTRQQHFSVLRKRVNELCIELQLPSFHHGSILCDEALTAVHIDEIWNERTITFTNDQWQPHNSRSLSAGAAPLYKSIGELEDKGELTCRWKFIEFWEPSGRKKVGCRLSPLAPEECHPSKSIPNATLLDVYGDQPGKGKSDGSSGVGSSECIDLTDNCEPALAANHGQRKIRPHAKSSSRPTQEKADPESPSALFSTSIRNQNLATSPSGPRRRQNEHKSARSFGDICAGGGGVTRGAARSGLRVKWALDTWWVAQKTLKYNFPSIKVWKIGVEDIPRLPKFKGQKVRVDVLHISFPCQGHSYLNRGMNEERDFANNILITTLPTILEKVRPRVVTMEQTDGILTKNEGYWFRCVLHFFTELRYTTDWRVCNLAEYGNPQKRRRLMIMAAW